MSIKGSKPACLIALTAVVAVAPVASQQQKIPKTQVWIDVATHGFAGMPDMGLMGGLAMGAFGGKGGGNVYGSTRYTGSPGQYLDIAVLNNRKPGVPAQQAIPAGLKLGNSLDLLPYKAPAGREGTPEGEPTDFKLRILIYWGCGSTVRAGQPTIIEMSSKDGKLKASGAMQGRYVPDRTAKLGPGYVTWPNEKNRQDVRSGASLIGGHAITGDGMPESLKFQLEASQDFMPKIDLRSTGDLDSGITWNWQSVGQARGYFLHAIGQQGDATVFWSSAETGDAGSGVLDYLPPATVDKWIKERVLLGPGVKSCAMPKGIFGATGGEASSGGMLRMVAFGPETHFVYPPKPANPATPWDPEWNVRVRVKSSTIFPIGMDMSGMEEQDGKPDEKPKPKSKLNLLKGILGG